MEKETATLSATATETETAHEKKYERKTKVRFEKAMLKTVL